VSFVVRQHPWHILHEKYYSKAKKPPIQDVVEYMRAMNFSETDIEKRIKYHLSWKKNLENEQEKLDALFAKYKIKSTVKKKNFKPVKKM
jgi:DNA polymerase III delta prime subunit